MSEFRRRYGAVPSTKNSQFLLQVMYRLRIFPQATNDRIIKHDVARLNFQYYQNKQRVIQKLLVEIHRGEPTLVFIGRNPFAQNSPIRGYVRCPINQMLHAMEQRDMITLIYVDEYNSTKTCSFCLRRPVVFTNRKRHYIPHLTNHLTIFGIKYLFRMIFFSFWIFDN